MRTPTIAIPADTRTFHWSAPDGSTGRFKPNGPLLVSGYLANREVWQERAPVWAARLFVGFNVANRPAWTIDDLVPVVRHARLRQVKDADASFLLQRGLYTHTKAGRRRATIEEEGAQVIVLNLPEFKTSPRRFRRQMVALATAIARKLQQESVIIELQQGGIMRETIGVNAL